ncbi:MAG: tetratricopeptide repeat protein, partial [Elusimicrobiales bacterium]|nr:tetratricopeptide repeat protein [Elusimicrobiales bacterium]
KDIATAVFAHKSASDISDIHTNSSFVQETMKNMRELDEIEILIKNRLIDMDEMLNFFLYRKYSACAETAQKILEYDYGNMEAFFYRKRAQYHLNKELEFEKSDLLASLPDARETKRKTFNKTPKRTKKVKKRKISKKQQKTTKKRSLIKRPTKNIAKKARVKKRILPASPKPPAAKSKKKDFLEPPPTAYKKTARPKKASENDIIKKAQDYYVLGVKHYALGNMEKAKEYFKKCVKINPKHTKAKKAMERILKEQK